MADVVNKSEQPSRRSVQKEAELVYPNFRATITFVESAPAPYILSFNDRPSGEFMTSAAAVKFLRDKVKAKFGGIAPIKDTLLNIQRVREGTVVPSCWNKVPENYDGAEGRGLVECPTCPYRSTCASPEEVQDAPAPAPQAKLESDEDLIARLRAKIGGQQ